MGQKNPEYMWPGTGVHEEGILSHCWQWSVCRVQEQGIQWMILVPRFILWISSDVITFTSIFCMLLESCVKSWFLPFLDMFILNMCTAVFYFLVAQMVKSPSASQDTWVLSLSPEDPLGEKNGNPLLYSYLEKSRDRGAW